MLSRDTLEMGALIALHTTLPFSSGNMRSMVLDAPVLVGISDWPAALARLSSFAFGGLAAAIQDYVNVEGVPVNLGWVLLVQTRNSHAVSANRIRFPVNIKRENPVGRVVLQQVGERAGVARRVYRGNFNARLGFFE